MDSATTAYIYVVRHFIKRRGGKGGEQCSMTDQSGDGDYVIHGSVAFLSVCQKAVRLKKKCAPLISLHCIKYHLQPFLICLCCAGWVWCNIFLAGFQWELPRSLCNISSRLTVLISSSPACFLLIKLASLLSPEAGWQTDRQMRSQAGGQQWQVEAVWRETNRAEGGGGACQSPCKEKVKGDGAIR